jgi:hypothetical protein
MQINYSTLTNFVKFESDNFLSSNGYGRFSTLSRDVDFTVTLFKSMNPKAPIHQLTSLSPSGFQIKVGTIWISRNMQQGVYYQISFPHLDNFKGNLGKHPDFNDPTLCAIIPWT